MEKEIEVCVICNKPIILKTDHYVRVTDYKDGQFHTEAYYHNRCFHDVILKRTQLRELAFNLVRRTNKLLDKAGIDDEKEETYVIR